VRITGLVSKVSAGESSEYYDSRPLGSRIGAWASPQSQVIENRAWLDQHYEEVFQKMSGGHVQRPDHWGGYRVQPVIIEFWQGRPSRLHDRVQYSLEESGAWKIERLAP
jgi:pyridoxamine 5'-phosphate oxidase